MQDHHNKVGNQGAYGNCRDGTEGIDGTDGMKTNFFGFSEN